MDVFRASFDILRVFWCFFYFLRGILGFWNVFLGFFHFLRVLLGFWDGFSGFFPLFKGFFGLLRKVHPPRLSSVMTLCNWAPAREIYVGKRPDASKMQIVKNLRK